MKLSQLSMFFMRRDRKVLSKKSFKNRLEIVTKLSKTKSKSNYLSINEV